MINSRPKKYKTVNKIPGFRTYIRYNNRRLYCTETGRYVDNNVILKVLKSNKIRVLYRKVDITVWAVSAALHDVRTKQLRKEWAKIQKQVKRTVNPRNGVERLQAQAKGIVRILEKSRV